MCYSTRLITLKGTAPYTEPFPLSLLIRGPVFGGNDLFIPRGWKFLKICLDCSPVIGVNNAKPFLGTHSIHPIRVETFGLKSLFIQLFKFTGLQFVNADHIK